MSKKEIQKLKDALWANAWSNEEIIDEGIATLKKSMEYKEEGFIRIESAGLLAIYTLQQENKQLKYQLKQRDEVIDEAINTINNMIDIGYTKDLTSYFPTGLNGEFGIRALIIKEILQKYKGDNNE